MAGFESRSEACSPPWLVTAGIMAVALLDPAGSGAVLDSGSTSINVQQMRVLETAGVRTVIIQSSDLRTEEIVQDDWVEIAAHENWHSDLSARIEYLSEKEEGWKGEGSVGPSLQATGDANTLLKKLSVERVSILPSIGLDFDGAFSFFWTDDDLIADLSVFGDGTYSFFAKRGDRVARADEAELSKPVDKELLNLLSA